MVAPLDIKIPHGGEHVQDLRCTRSAVEDIANDMQRVNGQRMNEIRYGYQQLIGTAGLDDGIDDGVVVGVAVVLLEVRLVQ